MINSERYPKVKPFVTMICGILLLHSSSSNPATDVSSFIKPGRPAAATELIASEATFYLMGIGTKLLAKILAKAPIYTLSDAAKSLLSQDPEKYPVKDIIDREKITVSKGGESVITKAMTSFLRQALHVVPEMRSKLLAAYASGLDAGYVYDFLSSAYDYVPKLAPQAARMRVGELERSGIALGGTILNSFFGAYPKARSDLGYPLKTYHATALYCGPQDPYCLKSSGVQESDEVLTVSDFKLTTDDIAQAFASLDLSGLDPFAAGFLFAIVSFDMATGIAPLLTQSLMDPNAHTTLAPLIQKFLEKWITTEISIGLSAWYKSNAATLDEKDLEKKLKLGSLTRIVQEFAGASQIRLVKNLLNALGIA